MLGFIKSRLGKAGKGEKGFTLIEMLVVVGIIVALAAIIVPLVISFSGSGEDAAQKGERETIQTSIQSLMVDEDLKVVTVSDPAKSTTGEIVNSTGTQFNANFNLQKYMDQATSKFCYRWGADSRVTYQYDVDSAGACTTTKLFGP